MNPSAYATETLAVGQQAGHMSHPSGLHGNCETEKTQFNHE